MPTPGQIAIADGHAATLSEHGQLWSRTSDGAAIVAFAGRLRRDDPRMEIMADTDFPIFVADAILSPPLLSTQVMPSTRLRQGDELTKYVGSTQKFYRVIRADFEEATGIWTVILTASF